MKKHTSIAIILLITFIGAQLSPWLSYARYCVEIQVFLKSNYKSLLDQGSVKKVKMESSAYAALGYEGEDEIVIADKLCDVLHTEVVGFDVNIYLYEDEGEGDIIKMIANQQDEKNSKSAFKFKLDDYQVCDLPNHSIIYETKKEYLLSNDYIIATNYITQIMKPPISVTI